MSIKLSIRPPDTKNVAKVVIFDDQGRVLLLKRKEINKKVEKLGLIF